MNGRPVIYRESVSGETIDASSNPGAIICVNCTDITIRDTTTEAVTDGINLQFCRDVLVENVTADEVYSGVLVIMGENITVQNSSFGPDMRYGMRISGIDGFLAEENEIACAGGPGIYLIMAENAAIQNNTITSGTEGIGIIGLLVINSSVAGNTISGDPELGIGILLGEHMDVSDNTIRASYFGIIMEEAWNVQVSDNTVHCNDTGFGLGIIADGAEVVGNTAENCSATAVMILNNSVVRENHLSGAGYPVIDVVESGVDVYVYRNDFVVTDPAANAGIFIAGATATADSRPEMQAMPDGYSGSSLWDEFLQDNPETNNPFLSGECSCDTFTAAADIPEQYPAVMNVGWDTAVWHSPAEEIYWYRGQTYTHIMGNYWSAYNGTDTTHDGIGDTPFIYAGETIDSYPLVNPIAWYPDEKPAFPDDDDASADMATSPGLTAGQSATLTFTGSAVQTVTITAAEGTGRILPTVEPAPNGPDGLTGPVYQYLTADLSGISDDDVSGAEFSFRVPAAWLKAEGLTPAEIALWRFHDGVWQELPTYIISEEGGWISFAAITPGFSTFAIAEGDGQTVTATTETTVSVGDSGTETAEENVSIVSEPVSTVAIPEEEPTANPTEEATTPQESPLGCITIIGGAAGAVLLFRRR